MFKIIVPSYKAFKEQISQHNNLFRRIICRVQKKEIHMYQGICDKYKHRKVVIPQKYIDDYNKEKPSSKRKKAITAMRYIIDYNVGQGYVPDDQETTLMGKALLSKYQFYDKSIESNRQDGFAFVISKNDKGFSDRLVSSITFSYRDIYSPIMVYWKRCRLFKWKSTKACGHEIVHV